MKGCETMKNFWKKTSLLLVTTAMTLSAPLLAWALEHDIVILHTNDIHCGVNDNIGFAGLAQLKKDALHRRRTWRWWMQAMRFRALRWASCRQARP